VTEPVVTLKAFFERARDGQLTGVRCGGCSALAIPPKEFCPECHQRAWEPVPLSGEGRIASYTVIRVAPRAHTAEVPYAIAAVQLTEGVSLLGRVVDALDRCGLREQTWVIFTSDNGPWLSYGDHGGSAGPLREGKGTNWEGGVRVPCIVRWPGQVPAGRICREPWMTIDILPTLAHLAQLPLPRFPIDGKDVWPLWHGDPGARSPQDAYYFYWDRSLEAVRSGKWKLHFPHEYRTLAGEPGRDGQAGKYVNRNTDLALYDLENDVGEKANVAHDHPDIVERLMKLAEAARDDLGDTATKRVGKGVRPPGKIVE
jgi:uncharacterized OB-fold protein